MKIFFNCFLLIFLGFRINSVFAVSIPVPSEQTIVQVVNHNITAEEMKGMEISVNGSSKANWTGTSASDTGWQLTYEGTDTIAGRWKFTNIGTDLINTIVFDAFTANSVFDWEFIFGDVGTPDSGAGDFNVISGTTPAHEFIGPVKVAGSSSAEGDLFRWLSFDFTGLGGLKTNEFVEFTADTDQVVVPIPPAVTLFFSGLLVLVGLNKRS